MGDDIAQKLRLAHERVGTFMEVPWLLEAAEEIERLQAREKHFISELRRLKASFGEPLEALAIEMERGLPK